MEEFELFEEIERDQSRSSSRGRTRRRGRRRPEQRRESPSFEPLIVGVEYQRRSLFRLMSDSYLSVLKLGRDTITLLFKGVVLSSLVSVFLFYCALLTAIFYVFAYWYLIPTMYLEAPLYFDFDVLRNGQPAIYGCEACLEHVHIENRQIELPVAHVDLIHAENQWDLLQSITVAPKIEKLQRPTTIGSKKNTTKTKSKTEKPHKHTAMIHPIADWRMKLPKVTDEVATLPFRFLSKGEKYDIFIHLGIRDSDYNYQLGNVMVGVELLTYRKEVLASSRRPTIVQRKKPESFIAWFCANSLLKYLPLVGSNTNQAYVPDDEILLKIQSFEKFMEQDEDFLSVQTVKVSISQPSLQLHHAKVAFHCRLEGIRYYMYHWRTPTFLCYMLLFLVFEASTTIFTTVFGVLISLTRAETEDLYK